MMLKYLSILQKNVVYLCNNRELSEDKWPSEFRVIPSVIGWAQASKSIVKSEQSVNVTSK